MAIRVPGILSGRQRKRYKRLERKQQRLGDSKQAQRRVRKIEKRQKRIVRREAASSVPNVLSSQSISRAGDDRNQSKLTRLKKKHRRIARRLADATTSNNKRRKERLEGKLEGVKQRARDTKTAVKDERLLERQSRVRQDWLELQGQLAAQQQQQFNILEKNLRQQTDLIKQEARRSTAINRQILEEQRAYEDLLERRAQRERALANYQQGLLARDVAQQGVLTTGRVRAAQARRQSAPRTSILFG